MRNPWDSRQKNTTYRKNQADDAETEETCTHLSDGAVVNLLSVAQSTEEETHSQNEKKVGEDRAKQRRLDDANLVLGQGDARELVSKNVRAATCAGDIVIAENNCWFNGAVGRTYMLDGKLSAIFQIRSGARELTR
jgi:hypothetical protein